MLSSPPSESVGDDYASALSDDSAASVDEVEVESVAKGGGERRIVRVDVEC